MPSTHVGGSEQIVAWAMEINDKLGEFRSERRKGRLIREVFDGADVVFAVWQDPANPSSFAVKAVKGLGREGEESTSPRSLFQMNTRRI